jgi:organic radical activating enzyme
VLDELLGLAELVPRLLVITGGEPLLQQAGILGLLGLLGEGPAQVRAEIETNGTVLPSPPLLNAVHRFVVSPKLDYFAEGSRMPHEDLHVLRSLAGHAPSILKLVLRGHTDVPAARRLADASGFEPHRVWVMPEGRSTQEIDSVARQLADDAVVEGWNFSARLHIALWGDVAGR